MKIADTKEVFQALVESPVFHDYQRAFREVTGLPLSLQPVESWNLPHCGQPHENSFCAWMRKQSGRCASCLRVQHKTCELAVEDPCTTTCPQGLSETAVPIRAGNHAVAYLRTGQVLHRRPSSVSWSRIARRLQHQHRVGREELEIAESVYLRSPVMTTSRYRSAIQLLNFFADQLSTMSNQLLIQRETAESPFIRRTKEFLQNHYTEKLTLGEVAKAMNMSKFYFCKMFKKSTGLNFTHFLSRLRLDKSKSLLLNPHLRISEIAFEVGFQSLTHFNRVFKEVTGGSPTDFRARVKKLGT